MIEIDKGPDEETRNEQPINGNQAHQPESRERLHFRITDGSESKRRMGACRRKETKDGEKKKSGQKFDSGISKAEWFAARRAFSAKDEIADDGDIMVPRDRLSAFHAMGSRADNRLIERNPVDADIQERADASTEKGRKDGIDDPCQRRESRRHGIERIDQYDFTAHGTTSLCQWFFPA